MIFHLPTICHVSTDQLRKADGSQIGPYLCPHGIVPHLSRNLDFGKTASDGGGDCGT
jgi:hypothetical protein